MKSKLHFYQKLSLFRLRLSLFLLKLKCFLRGKDLKYTIKPTTSMQNFKGQQERIIRGKHKYCNTCGHKESPLYKICLSCFGGKKSHSGRFGLLSAWDNLSAICIINPLPNKTIMFVNNQSKFSHGGRGSGKTQTIRNLIQYNLAQVIILCNATREGNWNWKYEK